MKNNNNNNKLLSILLLTSLASSFVAGIFSVSKDRYVKSEAEVTSYKTIYLYVPNKIKDFDDKDNTEKEIEWDSDKNNVVIYTQSDGNFHVMNEIQKNLYFYTLSSEDLAFYFKTTVGVTDYISPKGGTGTPLYYNDQNTNNSLLTLGYYGYSGNRPRNSGNVGTWSKVSTVLNTAAEYANAFVKVLKDDVCGKEHDYLKVKDVWLGLEAACSDSIKDTLRTAEKNNPSDPYKEFAEIYDYVYWKYGNEAGFGSDFIGRNITPRSVTKYTPVIADTDTTKNVVVAVSIGAVSISLLGLYFFVKKRKEDR